MSLSTVQKAAINMGAKALEKYLKDSEGKRIYLTFEEVNNWLEKEGYPFRLQAEEFFFGNKKVYNDATLRICLNGNKKEGQAT